MPPRPLVAVAVCGAIAAFALLLLLLVQLTDSDSGDRAGRPLRSPRMTLEGVIALDSREHAGCPDQPALTLTADAAYNGDGTWTVTYRDYRWIVDEDAKSIEPVGDPLPCPRR